MEYKTGEFNRLMRAIDDTEKIYSPENYNSRGPEVILREYNQMQLEGYKIQQDFYKMIVDAKTIGLNNFDIRKKFCLLYTSPSPRDRQKSRMPSSA